MESRLFVLHNILINYDLFYQNGFFDKIYRQVQVVAADRLKLCYAQSNDQILRDLVLPDDKERSNIIISGRGR